MRIEPLAAALRRVCGPRPDRRSVEIVLQAMLNLGIAHLRLRDQGDGSGPRSDPSSFEAAALERVAGLLRRDESGRFADLESGLAGIDAAAAGPDELLRRLRALVLARMDPVRYAVGDGSESWPSPRVTEPKRVARRGFVPGHRAVTESPRVGSPRRGPRGARP